MENNELEQVAKEYSEETAVNVWGKIDFNKDFRGYLAQSNYATGLKDGFKAGAKFIIEQIEDFISKRTYNAHDMSNDNPYKQYYLGKDDAYCEILNLLKEINNEK